MQSPKQTAWMRKLMAWRKNNKYKDGSLPSLKKAMKACKGRSPRKSPCRKRSGRKPSRRASPKRKSPKKTSKRKTSPKKSAKRKSPKKSSMRRRRVQQQQPPPGFTYSKRMSPKKGKGGPKFIPLNRPSGPTGSLTKQIKQARQKAAQAAANRRIFNQQLPFAGQVQQQPSFFGSFFT